ncbi:hypothetical protein GALL_506520 [mine drainage metagenome]|uniref:Rap1a immunity protein domain-containing protein n=1 Tax=mine drainage metagenome TaxID=410659 RepID=A0A1J5P938_9ZZZZ
MRLKRILPTSFLMLLATPMLASSDEIQKMTVAELVNKCTTADPNSAAFCNGLVNGVLNQLQTNGLIFSVGALRKGTIGDEARKVLEFTGTACGAIEPKMALMTFINWAKIHPEFSGRHGITGVATAIGHKHGLVRNKAPLHRTVG